MNFQEVVSKLENYWRKQSCVILLPFDEQIGAGTLSPYTFLKVLGKRPWAAAYVQPSRRPTDGRYGKNPNRLYLHHQFQVVIKPPPSSIRELYISSLKALGLKLAKHEIKFIEDDWETAILGAQGIGWEVRLDGLEITQFTYFQLAAGYKLDPVSVEITYGLERLTLFLQEKESVFDINWNDKLTYGDLRLDMEREECMYAFDESESPKLFELFNIFESEGLRLLEKGVLLPGYQYLLKCSHVFNLLDARSAISITERVQFVSRMRKMASIAARIVINREEQDERLSM